MKMSRVLVSGLFIGALLTSGVAEAAASQPRDCDTNAVMYCGAYTKQEFITKLAQGDGRHSAAELQRIFYDEFGLSLMDFTGGQTVDGVTTKDGRVLVNGQVVATEAASTGRHQMAGSTKSGSLWLSPNSTAFVGGQIEAFVNMKNGQFQWAIIKSCGNTLIAKPVIKATPTPTPTPSKSPTPTPTPTPVAIPSPSPSPTPQVLSKTGPELAAGGLVGMGVLSLAASGYLRSRQSLLESLKRKK